MATRNIVIAWRQTSLRADQRAAGRFLTSLSRHKKLLRPSRGLHGRARAARLHADELRLQETLAFEQGSEESPWLAQKEATTLDVWGPCCSEQMHIFEAFRVTNRREAKDVAAALILSEAVYKAVDGSLQQAVEEVTSILATLPEPFRQPLKVQWALPHVAHRYLVAEGTDSVFVAFMGTKLRADLLTNAKVYQELLWGDEHFKRGQPAAHTGFVRRARSVPTESLLELAQQKGKRLIFCGHSLGGGVAEICVLDLLHKSRLGHRPDVQAIGFATPAIGNQALADYVVEKGWQQYLTSYLLPEDKIGKIFAFLPHPKLEEVAHQAVQAATLSGTECLTADATIGETDKEGFSPKFRESTSSSDAISASHPTKSNIVPFKAPSKDRRVPAKKPVLRQRPSSTYLTWGASLLYRTVTFPFWAHKSYVPPAKRLYLNPTGISRDPEQSQIASLAAASAAAFKDYKQVLQKAVEGVPSYKVQVMRMHRLPAYRTRFQQIISQAVSMSNCKETAGDHHPLELSHSIFPSVAISMASYCHLSGCSCLGLKQSLLFATSEGKQTLHWPNLGASLSTLKGIRAVMWAKGWLEKHGWRIGAADRLCVVIKAKGSGLSHITAFQLQLPDGQTCKAEVVSLLPPSPLLSLQSAISASTGAAVKDLAAWLGIAKREGRLMRSSKQTYFLKANLSCSQAQSLQGHDGRQLRLLYRTDFEEGSFPLQASPLSARSALPVDSKGSKQAVGSAWSFCHKC